MSVWFAVDQLGVNDRVVVGRVQLAQRIRQGGWRFVIVVDSVRSANAAHEPDSISPIPSKTVAKEPMVNTLC